MIKQEGKEDSLSVELACLCRADRRTTLSPDEISNPRRQPNLIKLITTQIKRQLEPNSQV